MIVLPSFPFSPSWNTPKWRSQLFSSLIGRGSHADGDYFSVAKLVSFRDHPYLTWLHLPVIRIEGCFSGLCFLTLPSQCKFKGWYVGDFYTTSSSVLQIFGNFCVFYDQQLLKVMMDPFPFLDMIFYWYVLVGLNRPPSSVWIVKLCGKSLVAHTCNSSTLGGLRQKDGKFKPTLNHLVT